MCGLNSEKQLFKFHENMFSQKSIEIGYCIKHIPCFNVTSLLNKNVIQNKALVL